VIFSFSSNTSNPFREYSYLASEIVKLSELLPNDTFAPNANQPLGGSIGY